MSGIDQQLDHTRVHVATSFPGSSLQTNMLYAAVPRLFYCIATHQHARETQRVPKFRAVHLATLYFLRVIGRWLIKVPNEAVNGLLQENILFLLMLLRRILCLQSREDSRFFAFFFALLLFF